MTSGSAFVAAGVLALTGAGAVAQAPVTAVANVTMAINPQRVCVTSRAGFYPNHDLIISNGGEGEQKIEEIRRLVRDSSGILVERRLLWQQGLELLGEDGTLAPKSTKLLFSPFSFSTNLAGKSLTYELLLAGKTTPVWVSTRPLTCANQYRMKLPVAGRMLVYDGFDFLSHHRRGEYQDSWSRQMGISDNFQRFGIDLVVIDAEGRFFRGDGSRTDQWLGWGVPVRAAAAGTVAAFHDGQPDNVVIGTVDRWTDRPSRANPMSSYGNYVLIQHQSGEFTLVGHLRNGSVRVKKGQRVVAGQQIGEIGNSGASGGVHVHFERRTGWGLAGVETLPAYFHDLTLIGNPNLREAIAIDSGDVVLTR
jgi:hypothetical protein